MAGTAIIMTIITIEIRIAVDPVTQIKGNFFIPFLDIFALESVKGFLLYYQGSFVYETNVSCSVCYGWVNLINAMTSDYQEPGWRWHGHVRLVRRFFISRA